MKPVLERFLRKITVADSGCWEWITHRDKDGYGQFWAYGKPVSAHRFIFGYYHGEIQKKMIIHHKCYNRACCNVSHLEQKTSKENTLDSDSSNITAVNSRKTHCIRGHEFTPENMYIYENKQRHCKKCHVIRKRQQKMKRRSSNRHI